MFLFRKRKMKTGGENEKTVSDKLAGKIAGAGIKAQKLFADKMHKNFMNTGAKKMKSLLIIFCLSAGGYSIYLLTNAIASPTAKQNSFKIDQMNTPKHFNQSGEESIMPEAYVDEETFSKIQGFKKYMDSIRLIRKSAYDSILQARPGLMDSVQMLEEIYHSQK